MSAIPGARSLPAFLSPMFLLIGLALALAGCASSPQVAGSPHGKFRVGRPNYTIAPYQVNGVWYYPKVDYSYDESGTASWYGEQFNNRPTSDGEIFDMNQLSAAHKTLPLPSVVEVTNLQNGRELRLRVNDRGPFVGDRLIDVSRRAAQLLGFERSGTTPVRVQVLRDESIQVAQAAMHGNYGPVGIAGAPPRTEVAAAAPAAPPMRHAPPPVLQMAAAAPPAPPAPEVIAPPAQRAPPPVAMAVEPPPRAEASAPRYHWPSLIAPAHAATLPVALRYNRRSPATARSAQIFIQAGAFAVPENAQRARARIAVLGSVEIAATAGSRAPLYRVRLGPVGNAAEAERLLGKVVDRGFPGARVVEE